MTRCMNLLLLGIIYAPARTNSFSVSAMITSILADAVIAKYTESPLQYSLFVFVGPFGSMLR